MPFSGLSVKSTKIPYKFLHRKYDLLQFACVLCSFSQAFTLWIAKWSNSNSHAVEITYPSCGFQPHWSADLGTVFLLVTGSC